MNLDINQLIALKIISFEKPHTNEDVIFTPRNSAGSLQLTLLSVSTKGTSGGVVVSKVD